MKKISTIALIFTVMFSLFGQVAFAEELTDISGHRNEDAIRYLYNQKVVSGYEDATYRPNNSINRAELLKILVEGKGVKPDAYENKNCFSDVTDDWYAKYVCYAKKEGWVSGYSDGTFLPNKVVSKSEAIKMLLASKAIQGDPTIGYDYFTDLDSNAWYYPFVVKAKKMALIEELFGELRPNENMTRAKISEMLYRSMTIGDVKLTEGTYTERNIYTAKNGFITYYFDPTLFPTTDGLNMYVRHTMMLQKKSYDYVVRFLGVDPQKNIDFAILSSDGQDSTTVADANKFVAYLKEQIKYENLKNLQFGVTGQLVLIFLAGDAVNTSWLGQGLASYVDNTAKYGPLNVKWVYCKDKGWEQAIFDQTTKTVVSSGTLINYSDFTVAPKTGPEATYSTGTNGYIHSGECFWEYVIDKYGMDKFKEIIVEWKDAQSDPKTKKLLVKDIINGVVGEDMSQLLKDRYNYVEIEVPVVTK